MYIKQLTVKGFKSYRDETVFGPFSPHHNVIVGKNGSGKSNFFAAVRFVLHDSYTRLMGDQKQALLHDHGASGLSGYVEIVFDNAEGRFPNNRDTATIRRTVGLQKDEYSVDGKNVNKQDILSMLEHAGFSKSNPYYIVPQGRVTALTTARDAERLALLKEVAGTRTYEEHRQESLKILEETAGKRAKIRELLDFIEERMRELAEERAELTAFQERDRERRAIESVLQQRELTLVSEELTALETEHQHRQATSDENEGNISMEAFDELVGQINTFESQLGSLREELRMAEAELRTEEEQRDQLAKEQVTLSLQTAELEQQFQAQEMEESQVTIALAKIEAEIVLKEDALATLLPTLQAKEATKEQLQRQVREAKVRQETLQTKQGRSAQFRSAAERDRFIRKEIETMEASWQQQERQINNLNEETGAAELKANDLQSTIVTLQDRQLRETEELRQIEEQLVELQRHQATLTEQRKELWRAENKLESSMSSLKEEATRQERALVGAADRGSLTGIIAVKRLASSLGIADNVYGPLYELFEVDPVYRLAVETIAGASLFHVVVDTDSTASRLLEALIKERCGRVTFMPLNRLRPSTVSYPPRGGENGTDAIPLIEQLCFDKRYEVAFRQVFGKAIVCPDLGRGAALARELGLTAITLKGDRADKRGALTGGHVEMGESKLELANKYRAGQLRLVQHQNLLAEIKIKLRELEPQINRIVGEIEASECRRNDLIKGEVILVSNSVTRSLEEKRRELTEVQEALAMKLKAKRQSETMRAVIRAEISSLQEELGTPLNARLSVEEQQELQALGSQMEIVNQQLQVAVNEVAMTSTKVSALENELDLNLRRQRGELRGKVGKLKSLRLSIQLSQSKTALEKVVFELENIERVIKELEGRIKGLSNNVTHSQAALDQARGQYDTLFRQTTHQNATLEKYLTKRMALLERREVLQRCLRELASLGDARYDELVDETESSLMKRLHSVNEELRTRFGHVNKRAHEQHAEFIQQGETLRVRQAELEKSARAIDEFIKALDRRKDEAIDRTFQQVALGFSQVFEQLVPAGRGELLMIRDFKRDDGEEMNSMFMSKTMEIDEGSIKPKVFEVTGVGIKVSFNSKGEEGLLMSQLSGGQKSLVALALILAIQQCDPAPFYLFDEIDANLDAAYRTAVARLLAEMKQTAQFITTTFRPELCEGADAFWGVSFGERVSRVMPITREQALQFVEADPASVGQVEIVKKV